MMMWYMINEYRRKCGFDSLLLEIGGIESFSGETMVLSLRGPWIAQFSTSVFPEYTVPESVRPLPATSEWELGWQAANGTPCRWHPPTRS